MHRYDTEADEIRGEEQGFAARPQPWQSRASHGIAKHRIADQTRPEGTHMLCYAMLSYAAALARAAEVIASMSIECSIEICHMRKVLPILGRRLTS